MASTLNHIWICQRWLGGKPLMNWCLYKTGIWAKTQAVNWNGKSLIAVAPSQELKAESGLQAYMADLSLHRVSKWADAFFVDKREADIHGCSNDVAQQIPPCLQRKKDIRCLIAEGGFPPQRRHRNRHGYIWCPCQDSPGLPAYLT